MVRPRPRPGNGILEYPTVCCSFAARRSAPDSASDNARGNSFKTLRLARPGCTVRKRCGWPKLCRISYLSLSTRQVLPNSAINRALIVSQIFFVPFLARGGRDAAYRALDLET